MNRDEILATIKILPHFQGLDEERLLRIVACCRTHTFRAGESVFLQGDRCTGFFVIRSGGVRLYRVSPDGRSQTIHNLSAGQSFAEAAVFQFGVFPVSGEAVATPTELIEVTATPFLALFRGDERIAELMVGGLCQRLIRLVERVDELTAASAGARLARYLMRLPAKDSGGELAVKLPMEKQRLAGHLAIAPETLSRLLQKWRKRGIIEGRGQLLTLLKVDVIEAIADGADSPPA